MKEREMQILSERNTLSELLTKGQKNQKGPQES